MGLAAGPLYSLQRWRSAFYYAPPGSRITVTPTQDRELATPLLVPSSGVIDRIGIRVIVAGDPTSVCRLGIRAVAADGSPGTKVLDAGTVATDTTGKKEITVSQALAGPMVFVTATPQIATPASFVGLNGDPPWTIGAGDVALEAETTPVNCFVQLGVTGALPAGFTPHTIAGADQMPVVFVRAV